MRGLEPWIRKWWDVANARRFKLITKKYKRSLTPDEDREYELLQAVAESIVSYIGKKNPLKEFKLFCSDCKEPLDWKDGHFPTHDCPVHKKAVKSMTTESPEEMVERRAHY